MIHFLALLGGLCISFSAVFVRLALVSPVTATFFRAVYALPALVIIWLAERSGDRRPVRERWLAIASGLILAVDLDLWHESVALVGAGPGTVIASFAGAMERRGDCVERRVGPQSPVSSPSRQSC